MPQIDFDIAGARKAGATDKDIADYFKSNYDIEFDVEGAVKAGADDAQILSYLNTSYGDQKKNSGSQPSSDGVSENVSPQSKPIKFGYESIEEIPTGPKVKAPIAITVPKANIEDIKKRVSAVNAQNNIPDYIPEKVAQIPTVSTSQQLDGMSKNIVGRLQIAETELANNTKQLEELQPQVDAQMSAYKMDMENAATALQKQITTSYQTKIDNKELTPEEAQSQMEAEFSASMKDVNSTLVGKYGKTFSDYNALVNKQKQVANNAKLDAARLAKVEEVQGVLDRNLNKESLVDIDEISAVAESAKAQIGSLVSGTIPYMAKALVASQYIKSGMPTDVAFSMAAQGVSNAPLLKDMEQSAIKFSRIAAVNSEEITKKYGTVTEAWDAGYYGKAGLISGLKFAESIPAMGAAIGLTYLTGGGLSGAVTALPIGGVVFGAQNYHAEYADRNDMSEQEKLSISFLKGSMEMLFEETSLPLLAPLKSLLKTGGREVAKEAIGKTMGNAIKEMYKKFVPYIAPLQEGASEYITSFSQKIVDKLLDPTFEDKDWNTVLKEANADGWEAFGPGAVGGVAFSTVPEMINKAIVQPLNKKKAEAINAKLEAIDLDINGANIDDATKEILTESKQALMGELNDVVSSDNRETEHMTDAQKILVNNLNSTANSIRENMEKEGVSEETKAVLEAKLNEINSAIDDVVKETKDNLLSQNEELDAVKTGEVGKPTFENVPILTTTTEEVENAKNEVFNNLSKLEVGSVIENSDGEIKVVTEKSTDKKGNQLIGVVTYERQSDGSLRQMTNIVWASKSADGKIKLDYNPHSTGTNLKGERVTVTDQITDKKIDLSKENIFTEDENGNLVQINKAPKETKTSDSLPEVVEEEGAVVQGDVENVQNLEELGKDVKKIDTTTTQDQVAGEVVEATPENVPAVAETGLIVYHGTPHAFEKFDVSKLGTGEGAQAFGHGLYFTNEKSIAEGYANNLSSRQKFWKTLEDGNEISLSKGDYEFINKELDSLGYEGARAEDANIGNIKVEGKNVHAPAVLEALAVVFGKNGKKDLGDYGLSDVEIDRMLDIKRKISDPQLYTATLHKGKIASEYDYLKWGDTVSESQANKIGNDISTDMTGEQAYKLLSKKLGSDRAASDILLSKGIDGIEYKSNKGTGGSSGKGRNYVVFDEKSITIDDINGRAPNATKTESSLQPEGESKLKSEEEQRAKDIEILDTEKKIAQLEKEIKNAPVRPSKGVPSKKQLRIQMRNYKDQLSELKGKPARKKVTDSVLRVSLKKFGSEVDSSNLSHEEQVVIEAIGALSATDPDVINSDGNANLRKQGALKTKGGVSIDQIVTDFINENGLDESIAPDLRNAIISFVDKGNAYEWMDKIKEREAQTDPDAIRESEYYNYGYDQAIELEMTDEEISELENEIGQLNDLTQEEYEKLKEQFTEGDTETGEGANQTESATDSGETEAVEPKEKSLTDLAKDKVSDVRNEYREKLKEAEDDLRTAQEKLDKERSRLKAKGLSDTKISIQLAPYEKGVKDYTAKYQKALKAQENVRKFEEAQGDVFKGPQGGFASTGKKTTIDDMVRSKTTKAEAFNFHQRVKKILEKIGVPVAEKNLSKKFLGVFKHRSKNVRIQSLFDFVTATHETAHYISREFGLGAQIFEKSGVAATNKDAALNKKLRTALTDIYTEFYPGAKRTHNLEKRVEEGIAVLLERYLVDPSDITARYPVLVENFINPTGRYYHPKFTELLTEMNNLISDYSSLTDEEKVGSRIARGEEVITKDEGFQAGQRAAFEMIYIGMPLRMADQMTDAGLTNESAEVAHFRWLDRQTVISNWINGGDHAMTVSGNGNWKPVGASVNEYLKLIDKREAEFDAYLVSRRALGDIDYLTKLTNELEEFLADIDEDTELDKEQIEYVDDLKKQIQRQQDIVANDKFDVQTVTNVVEKYAADKKFQEAAKIFDKLNNAIVDFAESTGLITPEQSASFKENKTYASFQRLVYDDLAQISATGTRSQAKVSAFLGRKGSDLQILSPIYSQVLMINETISKGLQNQIWQRLAALGDKNVEIARRFEQMETKRVIDKETGQISYPQDSQKDLIKVWNNGQRTYYKPAPEVVAFAETMSPQQFEFFSYALRYASGIFSRLTTTANPLFPLVNIPVDTISAWINTKTGFKPVYDQVRTLKDMAEYGVQYLTHLETVSKWFNKIRKVPMKDMQKEDLKMFEKYLALGGKSQTQSAYYDLTPEELIAKTKGGTVARKIIQTIDDYTLGLLEMPSNMSEYMTRFAEFKRAKEKGYSDDVAMYMASQVSVPFQQSGRFGGRFGVTYVKSIPYFNATLQVAAKFLKTAGEDPVRVGAIATSLFATSVAMAVASMKYADDDDRRTLMEQGPEELSKYIYMPNSIFGGKGFSRLRIPEQIGMITGPAYMYVLETYGKVKYDMGDYIDASTVAVPSQFNITKPGAIPFTWLPQALKPSIEVASGIRSYPEVRPIVPLGLEHKLPEYQYTQYTTESAKFVGKFLKVSPVKVDHFVKAQFGAVPSMLMSNIEAAAMGKESRTKSRLNIQEKDFVLRGKSYNDFYEYYNYWSKKNGSIKDLKKDELLTDKEAIAVKANYKVFSKMKGILTDMRAIDKTKELPSDVKQLAFEALLELNNAENPYTANDKVELLKSKVNKLK